MILGCHEYMYFFSNTYFYFSPIIKLAWILYISIFSIFEKEFTFQRKEYRGKTRHYWLKAGLRCWYCAVPQKVFSTGCFYDSRQQTQSKEMFPFLKQTQPRQRVLKLHEIESKFIIDSYQHWSPYQGSLVELSSVPQTLLFSTGMWEGSRWGRLHLIFVWDSKLHEGGSKRGL